MSKLVVIPVCDFIELLPKIIQFYTKHLSEAQIFIVDDCKKENIKHFQEIWRNIIIHDNQFPQLALKGSLFSAYLMNQSTFKKDIIIINEHDVIPDEHALYAMLHIFEDAPVENYASVSCVYRDGEKLCYPSHKNWFKDKPQLHVNGIGRIALVQTQGIPFGFSIWKAELFKDIDLPYLPDIWKLDYLFGKYIWQRFGLYHMRLLDYSVQHYKKGVRSWEK